MSKPISQQALRSQRAPFSLPAEHPHHYPQPNAKGIAAVRELYQRRLGREITEDEAYQVLARVMRYLWAINSPNGGTTQNVGPTQLDPTSSGVV